MQGGHATFVQRVGICASFDEISNYLTLRHRIPVLRAWTPVGSVVKWFSPSSVTSSHIGAFSDEQLGGTSLMRGCSDMQRRVTAVHVVTDRGKEVPVGTLAARPDTNRTDYEITR
jgi:hypothetical protein